MGKPLCTAGQSRLLSHSWCSLEDILGRTLIGVTNYAHLTRDLTSFSFFPNPRDTWPMIIIIIKIT